MNSDKRISDLVFGLALTVILGFILGYSLYMFIPIFCGNNEEVSTYEYRDLQNNLHIEDFMLSGSGKKFKKELDLSMEDNKITNDEYNKLSSIYRGYTAETYEQKRDAEKQKLMNTMDSK